MPKSQRTNLVKTAAVETELGEFKSDSVKTVQFEAPVEKKSMALALAEGLNIGLKAATTFAEGQNKETRLMESIKQEGLGKQAAGNFITTTVSAAADLPLTATDKDGIKYNPRRKFMMEEFAKFNETMQKNDTIHSSYYKAAMTKTGRILEDYGKDWDDKIIQSNLEESRRTLGGTILENIFDEGATTHATIQKVRNSQRFDTREEATTFVLKRIAGKIEEDVVSRVLTPLQAKAKVAELLKIPSADGVIKNFAADPKYKEIIDGVEATIKSAGTNQHAANKAIRDEARDVTRENLLGMLLKDKSLPEVKAYLKANEDGFSLLDYNNEVKNIEDFFNTAYSSKSNPEVYNMVRNSIANGTYTPGLLSSNKENLTIAEYKKLNEEHISYTKAILDDRVSLAKDTFNNFLSVGKDVAGQNNMFEITKTGLLKKALYTKLMVAYRNDFISAKGWGALTLEDVNTWNSQSLKAAGALTAAVDSEDQSNNNTIDGVAYDDKGNVIDVKLNENADWTPEIK